MSRLEGEAVYRDRSVDDVMRLWPATIRVFLDHRMKCVGCPVGRLHTIGEGCAEHQVALAPFLAELDAAIASAAKGDGPPGQDPAPGRSALAPGPFRQHE